MTWLKSTNAGVSISIHLTPRARQDSINGIHGDALKIKIKAPPVDGKANAYLLKYIARRLGIPGAMVTLAKGETSRDKVILVRGLTEEDVRGQLS